MSEKYNGWTNYETWNFALWYDGSFDDDRWDYLDNANPKYEWETKKSCAIQDFADYLKDFVDDQASDLDVSGMFLDILNANLSEINFYEVAESWIDDIYDEWVANNSEEEEEEDTEEE